MKNPRVFPSSPEVQVSMHDVLGMDVHPEGFSGGLDPGDWLDYRWGSGPSCNPSTICKKTWQASLSSIWPQIPIELTVRLGCSIREWPNPWTYQSVVTQGIEITARSTRSCSLSSLLFWMQELSILPKMWDICASTIRSGFELSTFSFILSLQATWLQWQRKHPTEQLRFADIFQVTIWHLQQIFTQISSKRCGGWETSVKIQMYTYVNVDNIYHITNIYIDIHPQSYKPTPFWDQVNSNVLDSIHWIRLRSSSTDQLHYQEDGVWCP